MLYSFCLCPKLTRHFNALFDVYFSVSSIRFPSVSYEKETTVPRTVKFKGAVNSLQLILLSELCIDFSLSIYLSVSLCRQLAWLFSYLPSATCWLYRHFYLGVKCLTTTSTTPSMRSRSYRGMSWPTPHPQLGGYTKPSAKCAI